MKRTFLYLFTVVLLGTMFSSCLGDTESVYEGQGTFAVISEESGQKVALFAMGGGGYKITSNSLSNYNVGDIVFMSYKINFNNMNSTTLIIPADYVSIAESDVYRASEQTTVVETAVPEDLTAKFKTLNLPPYYSSNSYFLDRWLFSYTYAKKKGEEMDLELYYDPNNQDAVEGASDTYIIDVKLRITGLATGTETTTTEGAKGVNMQSFRRLIRPAQASISSEGTSVAVWFRYYKDGDTDGVPTIYKGCSLYYTTES